MDVDLTERLYYNYDSSSEMILTTEEGTKIMSNTKKSPKTLSKSDLETVLALDSVASRIRYLATSGMSRGDISRTLSSIEGHQFVRYQWVRNVLETPLKNG